MVLTYNTSYNVSVHETENREKTQINYWYNKNLTSEDCEINNRQLLLP